MTGSRAGPPPLDPLHLLDVLDGGLLTTIQDEGRPDWTHLGVPESGAADPWSLAVANLLVGNETGLAALEMTLVGPTLVARSALTIALAGADLGARIRAGRRLAPGCSHRLAAGDVLEMPGDAPGGASAGSRGYLAVSGGVEVPVVLGSRSTCLAGGFGGLDGRALRAGDVIAAGSPRAGRLPPELAWPTADADTDGNRVAGANPGEPGRDPSAVLRVLPGPDPGLDALVTRDWRVGSAADRVGIRLDGDPLPADVGGESITAGVPWGAIQVPPDGRPIVLGADHQVTGGYRVAGVVISADRPILGQLRPGTPVRLVATDPQTALAALQARGEALATGAAALREAAGWDALIDAAGS